MLTRVEIENFKAIEKLSMDFTSRLTVIVGPNGSGKTSILQAILSVLAPREDLNTPPTLRSARAKTRIAVRTSSGSLKRDAFSLDFVDGEPTPSEQGFYVKINSDLVGTPSRLDKFESGILEADGSNLTSLLVLLRLNKPEKFDEIQRSLTQIIPSISRISLNRSQQVDKRTETEEYEGKEYEYEVRRPITVERLLFDTSQRSGIEADAMSEGTLIVLAILSALVNAPAEAIVLLDDIDASLHPAAQSKLVETVRVLLDSRPGLQIIATTHSPYLLNSLDFDEIRLTTLDDEGRVVCGRLTDHPDFERWKDEMTPGEMWGMWGESWLTKNRQEVLQS